MSLAIDIMFKSPQKKKFVCIFCIKQQSNKALQQVSLISLVTIQFEAGWLGLAWVKNGCPLSCRMNLNEREPLKSTYCDFWRTVKV